MLSGGGGGINLSQSCNSNDGIARRGLGEERKHFF